MDANGILGTMCFIIDFPDAKDTPSAGTLVAFSRCRLAQPSDMPSCLREAPRPTASRLRRSFSDRPHMQLSRDLVTTDPGDTIAVAVCVSLGGTGLVAIAVYVIMMYRRRQKILDAQDTLPRPFEVAVPAATTTGASMIARDLTSVPTLNISPPRASQSGGNGSYKARREETPTGIQSLGAGSAPIPTTTTPSQPQPRSSRDARIQPHLSDSSLSLIRAGPSLYRTPPRSWPHSHPPTPPDPQSQSTSRVQPRQSSSSLPDSAQPQRKAGTPATRSASVQERRSAKHALWLSRSASELYRAASSVPRYRVPEDGPRASSSRYAHAHRYDGHAPHIDAFSRPTSHLRQWHSASPVAHVQRVCSDSEEDMGGAIVFQHQDAGVMHELPPPYHKLVRSGVEV
ncbi:hypothetical protein OG21DRAFT_381533 [Imleria badia]|nr:hypothetical protein OG21DRAFT_381533 [Imleria badia]